MAFTDEEYEPIAARAAAARVSVARYAAGVLIAGPRPVEVPPLLVSELVLLRRIAAGEAGNLNQIARAVNAGYQRDAGLPATARAVRESLAGIDALLARIGVPAQRNASPQKRTGPADRRSVVAERLARAGGGAGVIAKISRGRSMRGLMEYLFGPGRHNEHVDQHLVAGWDRFRRSAPPELWQSQPGTVRQLARRPATWAANSTIPAACTTSRWPTGASGTARCRCDPVRGR